MHEHELTRPDGERLHVADWPAPEGRRRASVLLVHGLGEHSGRYAALARQLQDWGFAVRGYDHYGHGRSSGARGALPEPCRLLDDLAAVVDATRAAMPAGEPLIVLGHSMGALVAASFVARALRPLDACVLSAPALAVSASPLLRLLAPLLVRLVPDLRMGNGLKPADLSHDPAVVAAYVNDPLCHDRISVRLGHFIISTGAGVLATARRWPLPTLLMWGSGDRMIDPEGCRQLAQQAPAAMLQAREFEGLYHEIFNELDRGPVYAELQRWLDEFLKKRGSSAIPASAGS
ncbi:alpha/beta hydrolase [Comamonas sp. NLF-1-9]|uniref:alpha/beta hydrolase n=1 Tax=Comamonas sp. NLF-1-9 TaxID=2853163 RepID=UPI001C491545|nr:alpha/beta hydrolase [Comamonas sp. NLF-1-9]QXL83968.1 lysophospholipase [Comamonas sp. NLF-1-9]